jgi:hypothetical protein
MMEINELKALLAINKNGLDEEISRQPMLFFDVAEACVDAMAERDAAKEELASADAELDGLVRTALNKSEDKVTEAMVRNSIQMHKKHVDAFDAYMGAKTKADMLLALKEAFGQRSYMLRDLVQLYVSSYYEQNSVQGTAAQDKIEYNSTRKRLSVARERTGK